jgi:ABC-type transport system substrate-binding protein
VRLISIDWGEIGINVIPRSLTAIELQNNLSTGNYQAVLGQFSFNEKYTAESIRNFYLFELNNYNNFQNFIPVTLNSLITTINNLSDENGLPDLSNRFQYILNQNLPCLFLFFEFRDKYAINPRFENIITSFFQTTETNIIKFNPKNEWFVPKDKQKY